MSSFKSFGSPRPRRVSSTSDEPRIQPYALPRVPIVNASLAAKSRTSHACDRCRLMRTKCSGGDRCTKCVKDDAECAYGDRKREKNKKDLAESLERIDILEGENQNLLSALRSVAANPHFQASEHSDIVELLAKYSSREQQSESGQDSSNRSQSRVASSKNRYQLTKRLQSSSNEEFVGADAKSGERSAASSVGSPGRQDELTMVVDLDGGQGAAGFVGKMSEMAWIQRTWEHLVEPPPSMPDIPRAEIDHQLNAAKNHIYFMDDTDVLAIDEDHVNELECPTPETALILSEAYFHALQGAFHFVHRQSFLDTLRAFPHTASPLNWASRRWLALANMIWAIGSKWLELSKLDHLYSAESHLVFYARARRLGLDHRVVFDHPDVERVEAIGILALYLFVNGSIARAWNTLGQAIRHATALGMHLRITDPSIHERERHRRAHTWYSLYSLEVLIAEVTGRPKSLSLGDVTISIASLQVPKSPMNDSSEISASTRAATNSRAIWLNFLNRERDIPQGMTGGVIPWRSFASVGQAAPASHFPQRLHLCRLSDKIAAQLYSGTADDSWAEIQRKIGELQTELRQWAESLPDDLAIQSKSPTDSDPRMKIELSMYYHSIQMILHRPCLCQVVIENESVRSQEFNRSCARACVHAAMSMLAVMPDNPSAHESYQLLPFWALLHYVAQATVVLLMELSLDSQHFPTETPEVVNYLRKAMAYLWCMTESSLSAYRAWRILRRLLSEISNRYEDLNIADVPQEAPQPSGWGSEDEDNLKGS